MKSKSDPRASRSRQALLDAAIEMFLFNPVASLSDVARHAGVGRATLYRHFESREALVRELALESLHVTDEAFEPLRESGLGARETLQQGLQAVMRVADRFHFLMLLWQVSDDDDQVDAIYRRQLDDLTRLIERGKREKSIDASLSTPWITYLVDSLVYAGWWSIHNREMSPEEAGRHAAETLFRGISATD